MEEETQPVQQKCDQGWRLAHLSLEPFSCLVGLNPQPRRLGKSGEKLRINPKTWQVIRIGQLFPLPMDFQSLYVYIILYLYHISYLTYYHGT